MMRKLVIIIILIAIHAFAWAGFATEDFDDASAWSGYTPTWPYNVMTFSGNDWLFYDVVMYNSGSDYELELRGYNSGKVSSHYFEDGVGTITFKAAKLLDVATDVKVLYSIDGNSFTQVMYNFNMYVTISSTSSSTYNIPVNNSEAHYIRIQAHYGNVRIDDISVSDEISAVVPTVTVASISDITKFTAQGGGNVTSDGGATVTVRGICWSTSSGPNLSNCGDNYTEDGGGTGLFTSQLAGLDANTFYYVRAYATNSVGTAYSEFNFPATFTTENYVAPTATTNSASSVNHVFATMNGTVNGDEANTTVVFEYGLTESYGSEVAAVESPFTSGDNESVHSSLNELDEYTTYHYRVKATNVIGTTYGDDKTFTTTDNPNVVSTQSIPPATPDPDPIEFTGTGVTLDFSNVSGATGSNDITVSQYNVQPTNLTGIIGSEVRVSNRSYLITNHTGFTFSTRAEFLIDNIPGVNPSIFEDTPDGEVTDIKLWKRSEYGTGDFVNLGYLLYDDGSDDINVNNDDLLYLDGIDGFSEFTFSSEGDHSLSVILSTFTAQYITETLALSWQTASENDNLGWNIYRNQLEDFSSSQSINDELIPGHGTSSEPNYYTYFDRDVLYVGETYYYWLESIDLSGFSQVYDRTVEITIPDPSIIQPELEPPVVYELKSYPNPIHSSALISFTLDKPGLVSISIYNMRGELVKKLPSIVTQQDESDTIYWNGKDDSGKDASPGIYLYNLIINGEPTEYKKMILVK